MSRKGGTGEGGWVHPKGANTIAASGLVFRSDLVGPGRAISILFGINGVQRVQTPWPCLGLSLEATWLALGGPFLSFLG